RGARILVPGGWSELGDVSVSHRSRRIHRYPADGAARVGIRSKEYSSHSPNPRAVMKHTHKKSLGLFLLGFLLATSAFAQEEGDYRSAADGDWSNAATWEVFESSAWAAAAAAPNGSEVRSGIRSKEYSSHSPNPRAVMKHTHKKSLGLFLLGFLLATSAFAQEEGDYRSAADGDWSNAATWEVFESSAWAAAAAAPNGSEV